jgi:hypothetical protein
VASRSRLAQKVLAATAATVVCIGVLEVVFRMAGYKPLSDVYSKPELFWRKDALLGWSHQPSTSGTFIGPRPFPIAFRGKVRINSLGLRGPELGEKDSAGYRVLCLGDSEVAGFEVDEEKTFESLLERTLSVQLDRTVQVVNAGVRGYGTDQSYLYYRERGRPLHPDLVVFFASNNDPEDNTTLHRARRPFGKPAFALRSDESLELVGSPIPDYPYCSGVRLDTAFQPVRIDDGLGRTLCWAQTNLTDYSALFTFVALRIQQNPRLLYRLLHSATPAAQSSSNVNSRDGSSLTPAGRLTTKLIQRMAELARADGAPFILAIFDYDLAALDARALEASGVSLALMNSVTDRYPLTRLQWPNDGHFNELGHQEVAHVLGPLLLQKLRGKSASGPNE